MKRKSVKILLILVAALLLIPYSTTSVPEWKARVVDKSGNPVANAQVRQSWSHGRGDHQDDQISNEQGYVVFPARIKTLPLVVRISQRAMENIDYFVMPHGASIGGRANIWSITPSTDALYYYEGSEIKDTLVTKY